MLDATLTGKNNIVPMLTPALEPGPALRALQSLEIQPTTTADHSIFVAGLDSTINERFLLEHLLTASGDSMDRLLPLRAGRTGSGVPSSRRTC
jgi:oligoendopeptidase F